MTLPGTDAQDSPRQGRGNEGHTGSLARDLLSQQQQHLFTRLNNQLERQAHDGTLTVADIRHIYHNFMHDLIASLGDQPTPPHDGGNGGHHGGGTGGGGGGDGGHGGGGAGGGDGGHTGGDHHLLFGGNAHNSLDSLNQELGGQASLEMFPMNWAHPSQALAHVRSDLQRGVTPEISLNGPGQGNVPGTIQDMANGRMDTQLRQIATELSQMRDSDGHPATIYMRFGKEMNIGHGWQGTGNDFIRAWQHVHDVFQQAGADNVQFVWAPTRRLDPSGLGNAPDASHYWPGSQYVDVIGPDAYARNAHDASFGQLFEPFVQLAERTGRAFMVSETNIRNNDTTDQQRADWWQQAYRDAQRVNFIGINGFYRNTGFGDTTLSPLERQMIQRLFLQH